jgi:2,3-bisphosphoglycerate-independent phosphoglycerate mutase
MNTPVKKYVLIILDGAADTYRSEGKSPLAIARTVYMDFIARNGVSGLMQTLYTDLPKESMVAQLGMLGWEPHLHYPCGRASCELLASDGICLNDGDLAFRANLARMENRVLVSYNANYIYSECARPLIDKINAALEAEFSEFELYHNSDFRNTLVLRSARVNPTNLLCPEPHESHGMEFDMAQFISGKDDESRLVAKKINSYLVEVEQLLSLDQANVLFPWSASKVFRLPPFKENTGSTGKVGIVGAMDFLQGIAKAGEMEFFKVGTGRPDTDYEGKGAKVVELISKNYQFVVCHINAADEASHMGDVELKIKCLEMIDQYVVRPVVKYFQRNMEELGGVMIVPDHYSNVHSTSAHLTRMETHSALPVPFALWNGEDADRVCHFSEEAASQGEERKAPVNHLDLLRVLGLQRRGQT